MDIGADAEVLGLKRRTPTAPTARRAAEGLAQYVFEAAEAPTTATAAAPRSAGKTLRAEAEAFKATIGAEAAAAAPTGATAETLEALEARLALGVDLTAIERLALVLVAQKLVGGVQFGKARRRLRIVFIGVRMQLFRQTPIGRLDVGCARLAINAQDLIGITHPPETPLNFAPAPT